jgi:sterol desaturase/sphingolipid hydroxylase (fatty acid hydroxylase superfamily)
MAAGKDGWNDSKLIARAILHDRTARRKLIGRLLLFALLWMAAGLWLVDGWLAKNPWWFLMWWAACALVTCVVLLFALYDALAVIREERDKHR